MALNLKHQFFAAQITARRSMRELGGICDRQFFVDRLDDRSRPDMSAYSAAKAAIVETDEKLAHEFGPDDIPRQRHLRRTCDKSRATAPGLWMSEKDIADFRARRCLDRLLLAEDVARMALFLAMDDSAMITKQCFLVDGGMR